MAHYMFISKSFKKMDEPNNSSSHVKYVCYAQAKSLPLELDDWMETNPREQNMRTNVAQKIVESLDENSNFHELNRGILLSVKNVEWNNKTNITTIEMDDPSKHGNIDGGHTLRAILNAKNNQTLSDDRYVFMEILTGIETPTELAAARNTSVQVDLKSIEELKKSFDVLKKIFSALPFSNRIAYKMNEHNNEIDNTSRSRIQVIDIREIIAILDMFSQTLYPIKTNGTLSEIQPIQSYTGKETSLRKYINLGKKQRESMIENMYPIIKDVFELWDTIERNFPSVALKSGKRYGTKKYSKFDSHKIVDHALFSGTDLEYAVPKGLLYPILGSFRALVKVNDQGLYEWIKNPFDVWNTIGSKLVTTVLDEKADNPEAIGKNPNLWSNLFKEVYIFGYSM